MEKYRKYFLAGIIAGVIGAFVSLSIFGCDPNRLQEPDRQDIIDTYAHEKRMEPIAIDGGGGGGTISTVRYATWHWSAPLYGSPVHHYVVEMETDGGGWVPRATVLDTLYGPTAYQLGHYYRCRVAGVDSMSRQGPFSLPSDIYDLRATPEITVPDVVLFFDAETQGGGVILFDFSGYDERWEWLTIADTTVTTWSEDGLVLGENSLVYGLTEKLYDFVQTSGEISVVLDITPASDNQSGPARIFTCSFDPYYRNFTFGQEGNDLVVRMRTTATDNNGMPAVVVPDVMGTARMTIVYTRAIDGTTKVYVDGSEVWSGSVGGDISNWDNTYLTAVGDEFGGGRSWVGTIHTISVYNGVVQVGTNSKVPETIKQDRLTRSTDDEGLNP